jgi:peptidoglycan/xylan/chitin deacetylase (PgdA/CDA1 family)
VRTRSLAALRRRLKPLKRISIAPAARALDLLLRCTSRELGVAIVFHRVGDPPGDPETELVPALSTAIFREDLNLLHRRYSVVPAARLIEAAAARRRFERFPVAMTFDDDWSGHARVTAPLLAQAGVTATFFLNGASLTGPHPFWFELLQDAYDRGLRGPPRAIHEEAARIQSLPAAARRAIAAELAELLGPEPSDPGLHGEDVRGLAQAGHEIGFHTRDHQTLTTLDAAELKSALRTGREELEAAAGTAIGAIAYPAGKANAHVVERARQAGFARGYSTMPHPASPASDPLWVGRIYPSHESAPRLYLAIGRTLAARRQGGR